MKVSKGLLKSAWVVKPSISAEIKGSHVVGMDG